MSWRWGRTGSPEGELRWRTRWTRWSRARAAGVTMAVSLERTASEKRVAIARRLPGVRAGVRWAGRRAGEEISGAR